MGRVGNRPLHERREYRAWKDQSPGGTDGTVFQGNQEGGIEENLGRGTSLPLYMEEKYVHSIKYFE